MDRHELLNTLGEHLDRLPLLDSHTHVVGGRLGARGLHDVLLYHMAVSDLYAAGCPSGGRLTEYPDSPTVDEACTRIREAIPYLKLVDNTSTSWGVRVILHDLYGWSREITSENWVELDALIRARADDRNWHREILRRAGIRCVVTDIARRGDGRDDGILQYALEWAFPTRCQWGEFDTALYELERCWARHPETATPIGAGNRPPTDRTIRSLDDVHEAVHWYVSHIPFDQVISIATHISTDIDLESFSEADMKQALARRNGAGPRERDIYASYVNEAILTALEDHAAQVVFQFSLGAEPLPFETGSRLSQRTVAQLAEMVSRHPKLRFQCFLANRHTNQSMCTLCRELPNLSLAGYWWHNFFPCAIRDVMEERLDMLPANKQIGFFSDAYCVEWAYAKSRIIRRELAEVLVGKIERGQYDLHRAITIADQILFEAPRSLLGIAPVWEADGYEL